MEALGFKRLGCLGLIALGGCRTPSLTSDGQLVWSEGGSPGASVITANGVEFRDRIDVPRPSPRTSPYEAWHPATGFLLPKSGLWKRTSEPLFVHGEGIDLEVRASDSYAPSWGGEIFVSVEITAPRPVKAGERRVVVVQDDRTEHGRELLREVLSRLGMGDEVGLVDTRGAQMLVPLVSASRSSWIEGSWILRAEAQTGDRDVAGALDRATELLTETTPGTSKQVLLITNPGGNGFGDEARLRASLARAAAVSLPITAAASGEGVTRASLAVFDRAPGTGGRYLDGHAAISAAIAPADVTVARDLTMRLSSAPAPARIVEASGGQTVSSIEEDMWLLGDVRAGEARMEVLRISLPIFVPKETLSLSFDLVWADGERRSERSSHGSVDLRYTDDVSVLGQERNADVLTSAAAMGAVGRLGKEGFGNAGQFDAFLHVATWASMSLSAIGKRENDPENLSRARALQTLLERAR